MSTIFFPLKPNARAHLRPEAGAQRTLEAVRCSALFGADFGRDLAQNVTPGLPLVSFRMPSFDGAVVLYYRIHKLLVNRRTEAIRPSGEIPLPSGEWRREMHDFRKAEFL